MKNPPLLSAHLLSAQKIGLRFGERTILEEVELEIASGEVFALLGPSGSGKTSLLRIFAGVLAPSSGRLLLRGVDAGTVPPEQRGFPLVFQDSRLFPQMRVAENIAFGMRIRGKRRGFDRAEIRRRTQRLLEQFQLGEVAAHYPSELSGGQARRVAIARALATEPSAVLLDEPFNGLDQLLKTRIRDLLLQFKNETGAALIWVTHDHAEALAVADRMAVLNQGRCSLSEKMPEGGPPYARGEQERGPPEHVK